MLFHFICEYTLLVFNNQSLLQSTI